MADDGVQYEVKTVRTIRGTEARVITKWEKDGWEFVTDRRGKVQTELTFRRQKPKTPWRLIAVAGGALLVVAIISIIGVSLSGGSSSEAETVPTENVAAPSEQPSEAPASSEPEPSAPAEEEPLTVENSADLAALLTGPDNATTSAEFATKYQGRLIEFDGSIGAMGPHGDYDTRYDILITYGDYSATHSSGGPTFQFRDVNTTYDLHLTGEDIPETIGVGDNLHFVARVGEFETNTLLFLLEPVSTSLR